MIEAYLNILGVSPGLEAAAAKRLVESQFSQPLKERPEANGVVWTIYSERVEDDDSDDYLCSLKIEGGKVTSITSSTLNKGSTQVLASGDDVSKALHLAGLSALDTRFVCFHAPSAFGDRTDVVISTSRGKVVDITIGFGIYYKQDEVNRILGKT